MTKICSVKMAVLKVLSAGECNPIYTSYKAMQCVRELLCWVQEAATKRKQNLESLQIAERERYEAEEAAVKAELSARAEVERKIRAQKQAEKQRMEDERKR